MMTARPKDIGELYDQYIKPLPPEDRLQLLAVMARDLAPPDPQEEAGEHSLLELEGVGAELWRGIDAQDYVRALREEWDHRP